MGEESKILGVSLRGWLALMIVFSTCLSCVILNKIDILKDMALISLSFYFGQKSMGAGSDKLPDGNTKT